MLMRSLSFWRQWPQKELIGFCFYVSLSWRPEMRSFLKSSFLENPLFRESHCNSWYWHASDLQTSPFNFSSSFQFQNFYREKVRFFTVCTKYCIFGSLTVTLDRGALEQNWSARWIQSTQITLKPSFHQNRSVLAKSSMTPLRVV